MFLEIYFDLNGTNHHQSLKEGYKACTLGRIYSKFSNINRTQIDQSSPVQPISESREGTLSLTEESGRRTEILASNIEFVHSLITSVFSYLV